MRRKYTIQDPPAPYRVYSVEGTLDQVLAALREHGLVAVLHPEEDLPDARRVDGMTLVPRGDRVLIGRHAEVMKVIARCTSRTSP